MRYSIPLNRPAVTGEEQSFLNEVLMSGRFSGNGPFTKKCQEFLEGLTSSSKVLMTTSCTHALELATLLLNIEPGDEVILPTYTFASTANAFLLRGATLKFVDSRADHPGMDESAIEALITPKTKAVVPVHYAGVACDMEAVQSATRDRQIAIVEDAAHSISGTYTDKKGEVHQLGSIGDFGVYSFHVTKNIQSGEGGALLINNPDFADRAEILWEKGTNRAAFSRNEIKRYEWLDIGSSYLPAEIVTAFLFAQLNGLHDLQAQRMLVWNKYHDGLKAVEKFGVSLPAVPSFAQHNGHIFYLVCKSDSQRDNLIQHLTELGIQAASHYQPLHRARFLKEKVDQGEYPNSERYFNQLVRLPVYASLSGDEQNRVIQAVISGLKKLEA